MVSTSTREKGVALEGSHSVPEAWQHLTSKNSFLKPKGLLVIALCPFEDASDAACFTSPVFSPSCLLCWVCICFQLVTSWAVPASSWAWLPCCRGGTPGRQDSSFNAAPTPAFRPSGALTTLFTKTKKSVTWCLMNCKLALQMEIFIFQFI